MRKPKVQETALERVRRTRAVLLEDQPFYGFLALRLKLVEDTDCETMWTDGVSLGFSPTFVMEIAEVELKGVICHEVLHVVGKHPWRQEFREHEQWNEACDYAINPICMASRYVLPHGVLYNEKYIGWSAEAIYRDLGEPSKPQTPPQGGDNGSGDEGEAKDEGGKSKGKPSPGKGKKDDEDGKEAGQGEGSGKSPVPGTGKAAKGAKPRAGEVRKAPAEAKDPNSEYSEDSWAMAIQTAINAQGDIPLGLLRYLQEGQRNKVNWEEVLRDFFERSSNNPDYTWRLPAMRYVSQGLYMPRLEGVQLPPIVFAIDSSGSMPDSDIAQAQSEMQAIMDELNPEVLYVLYCDAAVVAHQAFYPGDTLDLKPRGGGGTDFRPVFEWVKEHASDAAGLVYLTDLAGTFPDEKDVEVPTLWVATSTTSSSRWCASVPFGTVVQMPVD